MVEKNLFIHIPKTAGFSVSKLEGIVYSGHTPALLLLFKYGKEYFESSFKFTIARNPYDRALSTYFYFRKMRPEHRFWHLDRSVALAIQQLDSFASYCENLEELIALHKKVHFRPQLFFITINDRLYVDYIARFETLGRDWATIADKIGVASQLPHLNSSSHRPWSTYYTEQERRIVHDLYREDFEALGYRSAIAP